MIFEVIGWIGAFLFILSYFLLSRGVLKQDGVKYHFLNFLGAVCLVVNAIHFKDTANIFVNVVWALIALMSVYNFWNSVFRNKSYT